MAVKAKQAAGSFQEVQGKTSRYGRALRGIQDELVQKEYERAVAGNAQAQFELGERFYQGLGVEIDYANAAAWFELAAKQGHPGAQRILAMIYFLGRGVAPDPAEAYKWVHLACVRGEEKALSIQKKIAAKISAEARAEGEKRAANMAISPSPRPIP